MEREKRLAIAGKDARMSALLECLALAGWQCVPLSETAGCRAAVLPMPYSADGVTVKDTGMPLAELFRGLPDRFPVLGADWTRRHICWRKDTECAFLIIMTQRRFRSGMPH